MTLRENLDIIVDYGRWSRKAYELYERSQSAKDLADFELAMQRYVDARDSFLARIREKNSMKVALAIFYWTTAEYGIIPNDPALLKALEEKGIKREVKIYEPWIYYWREGANACPLPCIVLRDANGADLGVMEYAGQSPKEVGKWILTHTD